MKQVQQNKQQLSAMKRKVGDAGVEELRPGEPPAKINSRWTNDELLMAVTAVRKYGKGFPPTELRQNVRRKIKMMT